MGIRLPGGSFLWQKCVGLMNKLVSNQDEATGEVLVLTFIKQRDSFLRVKKSMGSPSVDLAIEKQDLSSNQPQDKRV